MTTAESTVLRIEACGPQALKRLLAPQGLDVRMVDAGEAIPGSHWGESEAGLVGHALYARADTPLHSVLHEAGHWLLMSEARRRVLHTDAQGTLAEENAACYLQIVLADHVDGMGQARMLADMDAWGYSFRLGSAQRWFADDADDTLAWLQSRHPRLLAWAVSG